VNLPGLGWGPVAGCSEHGDEPSDSDATELDGKTNWATYFMKHQQSKVDIF
jgi:hypothetical protein